MRKLRISENFGMSRNFIWYLATGDDDAVD